MSKLRFINTKFWSDPWIVDNLNALDRYLFLYFITNEHTNIAGIYELSLRTISFENGLEREELLRMLKRLEPKIRYMEGWVIVRNAIKNQNYANSKINTGIQMVLERVPQQFLEYVNWPEDFGAEKPKGSTQQQLMVDDLNQLFEQNNVVKTETVDKIPVVKTQTLNRSNMSHEDTSHSDVDSDTDSKTTVRTAATVGLKKLGRSYTDITILYEDMQAKGLVNDKFKAWYCSAFFKLGREKVNVLASQARADGKDPVKLFSHLLQKESGTKKTTTVG